MAANAMAAAARQDAIYSVQQLKQARQALENAIQQTKARKATEIDQSVTDLETEKKQVDQQISQLESSAASSLLSSGVSTQSTSAQPVRTKFGPAYQTAISSAGLHSFTEQKKQQTEQKKNALLASLTL